MDTDMETDMEDMMGNMMAKDLQIFAVDMKTAIIVLSAVLVVVMQVGHGMLHAGAVGEKNVVKILYRNLLVCAISSTCYWLLGYGFSFGNTQMGFIGRSNYGTRAIYNGAGDGLTSDNWEHWFYNWTCCALALSIIGGSAAGRCKLEVYIVYALFLSTFVYPIVVHWVWGHGWLSGQGARPKRDGSFRPIFEKDHTSTGFIDVGGSAVVHIFGGFAGLVLAKLLGPRANRFGPNGSVTVPNGGNSAFTVLGAVLLWFGWYGLNCGGVLAVGKGSAQIVSKVAMTTTISAGAGAMTAAVLSRIGYKVVDGATVAYGLIAGLAAISAGSGVVDPWGAWLIGFGGGIAFMIARFALRRLQIDDPAESFATHGAAGFWGCWAVGIFCTDVGVQHAGYTKNMMGDLVDNDACGRGEQFGVQIIGSVSVAAWTTVLMLLILLPLVIVLKGLKVDEDNETENGSIEEGRPMQNIVPAASPPAPAISTEAAAEHIQDPVKAANEEGVA